MLITWLLQILVLIASTVPFVIGSMASVFNIDIPPHRRIEPLWDGREAV